MPMSQHKAASVAAVGIVVALAAAFLRQRRFKTGSSSTEKRHLISVVGDAFCDVIVGGVNHIPEWGTDVLTDTPIALTPGGSACNTVLQLASLLRLFPPCSSSSNTHPSIVLHTALGSDLFGSFMRSKIAEVAQGQDVQVSTASTSPSFSSSSSCSSCSSSATRAENSTTCSTHPKTTTTGVCICLSGAADRAFITHRGVVSTFNESHLDLPSLYNSCFVHIAGFYNCPSLWPALPGILRECRKRGVVTSLSPQYDARGEWGGGLEELFPWLDLLLLNEMEALAITKGMIGRKQGKKDDNVEEREGEEEEKKERAVEAAARYFVDLGVRHVIVTRGALGAYALIEEKEKEGEGSRKRREVWQGCPRKEVVDTTGAGDSFNAGVLFRLIERLMRKKEGGREGGGEKEKDAWNEVLRMGCAMGSHIVTKMGASAPPRDREEILENLREIE
ncbi:carbohydrate kinase [Nannochloropsis oceanica]